jgi:hypothetical protein
LWQTRDLGFDSFLRSDIFDGDLGALRNRFRQNDQRSGGADGVSRALDGLCFAGDFQANRDAKQHALRAAALF